MATCTEDYRIDLIGYYTGNEYDDNGLKIVKEKPIFAEKGDLFVLYYSDLTEAIKSNEEEEYYSDIILEKKQLVSSELSNMVTVVEYNGEGLFTDLVSGAIFTTQVNENNVLDLVTKDYAKAAKEDWKTRLLHPLAISTENFWDEDVPILFRLDNDSKIKIMDETVPNRVMIIEKLGEAASKAREKVESSYETINERARIRNDEEKKVADFDKMFKVDGNKRRKK